MTIGSEHIHPDRVKPLGEHVVIAVDPRTTVTKGGIHLPERDTYVEHVMEGTGRVVAVGPGRLIEKGPDAGKYVPCPVEPGDRVCFRRFLKDAIPLATVDEIEYCILVASDIQMKVPEDLKLSF